MIARPRGRPAPAAAAAVARRLDLSVRLRDPRWARILPTPSRVVRRAAVAGLVAAAERGNGLLAGAADGRTRWELGILLADDALVRRLNREYRRVDEPTNVLSFPGAWPRAAGVARAPLALGDVVLARQTVAAEALALAKPVADHVSHLVVHGVLHLLGYDHRSVGEADEMERLEVGVLAMLGIDDPYADDGRRRLIQGR